MKLGDLCSGVYSSRNKNRIKNQEDFITELFTAAGATPYISPTYKKQLLSGRKPFTDSLKAQLRGKENQQPLENFFMSCIADDKVSDVLLRFGVPEKEQANKKALSVALALQMKALIDSDEEDVDNIIISSYQMAKSSPDEQRSSTSLFKPLYQGDEVYVNNSGNYKIDSHGTVTHTWSIMNAGKITWSGRKLVYRRGPKDRPEANPDKIDIPEVSPGESIKIATTFDGRGFDGIYRCIWEMQDADGANCFPNRDSLFCVTIDAKFRRS